MSDLLSAASLLMAVIAILYSLWYPELTKILEINPSQYKENNVGPMKQAQRVLFGKALPLSGMALVVAFVFLPDAVSICIESYTEIKMKGCTTIKNYDAVRTAYVLVFTFSIVLASYVVTVSYRIWQLWRKLGK